MKITERIKAIIADYIRESDKIMFVLCAIAGLYGCLAVFSATRFTGSLRQFIMQTACMLLGLFAAAVISNIDTKTILKFWFIAALGVVPVILTFFIGFAPSGTDDKAWLNLGFTTFQPAELLKICFIVTFSFHLNAVKDNINKLKYLIPVLLHGAFPVLLIHFQGDDGTALVFAVMMICMLFAAGVKVRYFVILFVGALIAAPLIYFFVMNEDQQARITTMFNIEADLQNSGYQQWMGRIALANGGFFGQGLLRGNLTQLGSQNGGVPEGYNDFIFVSIGEELGFVGCLLVIAVLSAICIRCLHVAKITNYFGGKLLCVGFFGMIFAQTVINLGMCLSLLPVIGVTLPFFSAGGTSLLCLYLGVGLVFGVYMHRNERTIYLH